MKTLQEHDIIRLMREEWANGIAALVEQVDMVMKAPIGGKGSEALVISHGLKVRHKKSQIRYTVSSVSPRDVILLTPEGENFIVDAAEIENEYQLD